ncbi:MAG: swr complex subunit [Vezdaea aestivalis]|nr:MAG: swr complex subunit [Vezdaea aestivalis]
MMDLDKIPTTIADTEDQEYHSASDEDFDPTSTAAAVVVDSASSSEDEATDAQSKGPRAKKRSLANKQQDVDLDFDNSGDEGVIRKGRKKAKRKGQVLDEEEGDGGEGGLIKTRAQRRIEKVESKPLASVENSTIDVEKLWAWMNATPIGRRATPPPLPLELQEAMSVGGPPMETVSQKLSSPSKAAAISSNEETITISRTYMFAGKTTIETKVVPKSSAEAKLWLAEQATKSSPTIPGSENPTAAGLTKTNLPLRRPLARKSMFDDDAPAPSTLVLSSAAARKQAELKAGKLTTVEKSKLDWAGYVDQEGIGEELGDARKGKEGYMGRMDFLGRVEDRRESDRRAAKA